MTFLTPHISNCQLVEFVVCTKYERTLTVMFIRTFMLEWSKLTVTERIPASTTTTERGKRKKATSEEARRHSTTDRTTYSFLEQRKCRF